MMKKFRPYLPPLMISVLAGIIVVAIVVGVTRRSSTVAPTSASAFPIDAATLGPDTAPVKIVEYSDFTCPYCKTMFDQHVLTQLVQFYPKQIQIIYRHFPSLQRIEAQPSAEAAQCAYEQGAFWPYHDLLFQNQGMLNSRIYFEIADQLHLNSRLFSDCLRGGRLTKRVLQDVDLGVNAGVRGTPTFFVNKTMVDGVQTLEAMKSYVETELAERR